jgi:hypothetical protein
MPPLEFAGAGTRLSPGDIDAEAKELGCSPAVIRAICDVEAAGAGYLPDGRPKILFEAHVFGRLSAHQWDSAYPNISAPAWDRSLYGAAGAHQYDRLAEAIKLNRAAALESASWGMFQIMGSNSAACAYKDVEAFVDAMVNGGERAHLDAFAQFVEHNHLDDELRTNPPQFAAFARGYNGPGYAQNAYDTKLAAAWRKWLSTPAAAPNPAPKTEPDLHYATLQLNSRGPAVRGLQSQLHALGYAIGIDGDFGPETQAAVVWFQKAHALVPDGIVGPNTGAAIARVQPPAAAA